MSYGRYAPKIKVGDNQIMYDPYMSPEYNAGAALGAVLGNLWGANYNKRGIEKAKMAGDEALAQAQARMRGEDYYKQANAALDTVLAQQGQNRNEGWAQMPGLPAATSQQSAQQLQGWDNDGQKWNVMQGVTPERAASQALAPDLSFRGDDFKINFARQQRALGRPEHQIEAALAAMEPQISDLDAQAKTMRSNNVIEQLARMDPTMNNAERIKLINSLAQDNPEMAKIFLQDTITNRDLWNMQRQEQRAQNSATAKATQQQAVIDERYKTAIKYGYSEDEARRYAMTGRLSNGSGSGRTGSSKSPLASKEFEYANKRVGEIEEMLQMGENLPPSVIGEYNQLKPYVDRIKQSVYGGYGSNGETNPWTDWNNVVQGIQNDLKNGATPEQILQNAQNLVQNGQMPKEFLQPIQNSLAGNNGGNVITPVEDDTPLFPNWEDAETRHGLAALSGDEAGETVLDYLTGKKNFGLAHR